jgi:hypothetical protein
MQLTKQLLISLFLVYNFTFCAEKKSDIQKIDFSKLAYTVNYCGFKVLSLEKDLDVYTLTYQASDGYGQCTIISSQNQYYNITPKSQIKFTQKDALALFKFDKVKDTFAKLEAMFDDYQFLIKK